jgi:heterodisulfide reductase subunit A
MGGVMTDKRILVIGGGIAGLTAARFLAESGLQVDVVERRPTVGGHAAEYACKATDSCVKCGACRVEEAVAALQAQPAVTLWTGARVEAISTSPPFEASIRRDGTPKAHTGRFEAVLMATGFSPFDPSDKPYGYGVHANVITNLELERILRRQGRPARPSDGKTAARIAFFQCVGSRDRRLGHLWCSQVCCGSALRMGDWIRHQDPEAEVTVFYIDIQTFGKDFQCHWDRFRGDFRMIRTLPGDVLEEEGRNLRVIYADPETGASAEETFDMVVLSIGLLPGVGKDEPEASLPLLRDAFGFLRPPDDAAVSSSGGVFVAGAASGPMAIADAVSSAGKAAWQVLQYLKQQESEP